ncbi:hypothetical protein HGM15179_000314, partial [Zosterops borbonicus]
VQKRSVVQELLGMDTQRLVNPQPVQSNPEQPGSTRTGCGTVCHPPEQETTRKVPLNIPGMDPTAELGQKRKDLSLPAA